MACIKHQDREMVNKCEKCTVPLCTECSIEVKDKILCENCIDEMLYKSEDNKQVTGKRNILLSMILSICPGGGHMYLGLKNRGLTFILIFAGMFLLDGFIDIEPFVILIYMYSVIDSFTSCISMNRGETFQDIDLPALEDLYTKIFSNKKILGYILIGLGVIGVSKNSIQIFNNIIRQYFVRWGYIGIDRIVLPALFLVLGIYLVSKSRTTEKDQKTTETEEEKIIEC